MKDKPKAKQNKKQKLSKGVPSTPGRYVLVNRQDDEEIGEDEQTEEVDSIDTADLIVRRPVSGRSNKINFRFFSSVVSAMENDRSSRCDTESAGREKIH